MRVLYDIHDKMEDELKSVCHKNEITPVDLETIYKIVDILKDITTIDAMHKSEYGDYSRGMDTDYSYARGRYSRSSKDEMIDKLTGMMRNAHTEEERENYRRTIDQLSR